MEKNDMKKKLNYFAPILILRILYWLILEFDVRSCAELPLEKMYKQQKADDFYNKNLGF